MKASWQMVKNAFANLGRGTLTGAIALALPPVLIRHMTTSSYAVWVLILQVVSYLGYLDFGLQTAVGRYIAFASEKHDTEMRDGIFSTAFAGLIAAGLLGFALVLVGAAAVRLILPSVPASLLAPMRICILIIGASMALGLPASAWNGVFVGLQRYEIPAVTTGAGRLLSAIGLIVAAIAGRSLVLMAAIMASANILSYVLQFVMLRRVASEIRFRIELITPPMIRELWSYCFSLTIWSFSMLLVNGFDLLLVGRFQFSAVAPYAVSATLTAFMAGAQNAIFSVIMPHAAKAQARQDSRALGDLLASTTKIGGILLVLTGLPLIVFAAPLLRIWIGAQFVHPGSAILAVLVVANMVRLTGTPYASILIGAGQQKLVVVSPLMEGVTNLGASLLLGMKFGAIGVAWGTLIGAIAAVLANILYNLPRTRPSIDCSKMRYVCEGMALPALCCAPVCAAFLAAGILQSIGTSIVTEAWLVSCGACAVVLFRSGWKFRRAVPVSVGDGSERDQDLPIAT